MPRYHSLLALRAAAMAIACFPGRVGAQVDTDSLRQSYQAQQQQQREQVAAASLVFLDTTRGVGAARGADGCFVYEACSAR